MTLDTELLKHLLLRARHHLDDKRLYRDEYEYDSRRRRETIQDHADRISTNMQENEDMDWLRDEIDKALGETPQKEPS